jgi:peptidylprolyl isomerase
MTQAQNGDNVKVHYTGKLSDGTVFDSSVGGDPLPVDLGSGQVIAGFEEALVGMSVGESKTVTVPHDKAYGPYQDEKVIHYPADRIPADIEVVVGMRLQLQGQDGNPFPVLVTEVSEDHVKLDANPPLAGQDLTFDLELIAINT